MPYCNTFHCSITQRPITQLQIIIIAKTGAHIYSLMTASLLTLSKLAKVETTLQMTAANNTSVYINLIVTLSKTELLVPLLNLVFKRT